MTDPAQPSPSPFSLTIPNFQVAWDSTSLGWLKTCPRLYQYQMIEQWQTRSKSIHLDFGGWYASGVERYAHYMADGMDHDSAVLKVVKWVLAASWGTYPLPDCPLCGGTGRVFACVGLDEAPPTEATQCQCVTQRGWESGNEIKNRYTLVRTLIWNLDERKDSAWKTVILSSGKPAVELSFNFHVFDIDGESISLSGHMDELVENTRQVWVKDDKTTKSALTANYFNGYTPDNQMTLYTIAGKVIYGADVSGVLVRAAQIGVGFSRFATQQVSRPKAVLEEWIGDTKYWITQARNFALNNHWPMNDTACNKFMGCPFRKVCGVSPSHRKAWLEQDFVKREWNPLQARGDI